MAASRRCAPLPSALTVAGSDSGGGAGVQADLRTFAALGVFGTSAITALTAQSPLGVSRVDPASPQAVRAQMKAVAGALGIRAIKTGMLFSKSIVLAVCEELAAFDAPLVVDPVMIATSGAKLMRPDAVKAMMDRLLPLAAWLTPNIPEAEALSGFRIMNERDMARAAGFCFDRWGASTVVKGGHFAGAGGQAVDIVCHKGRFKRLLSARCRVRMHADHGTGCTFSAALAAGLAKRLPWTGTLLSAKAFVTASLINSSRVGDGVCAMFPPSSIPDALADMEDFK